MTNLAMIDVDFRQIGDTTFEVWESEVRRVRRKDGSQPMLEGLRETYEAARPHSALFLAQAWLENQYQTTGDFILPSHRNPVSLRPDAWNGKYGVLGPYADAVISTKAGEFLGFSTNADCALEWKRRLFDEAATYKGGAYAATKTLKQMLAVYAPKGDKHPTTGLDNADIGYYEAVVSKLRQYAAKEGPVEPPREEPEMAVTFGKVPMFGYYDRYIAAKREGFGWNNLGPRIIRFVTLHRMVGTLRGTDGYFRDPSISSYTDFGVAIEASDPGISGTIYLWNYPSGIRAPWASGPVSAPYGDGKAIVDKYGVNAVNRDGISLEIGGTNQVIDAFAWGEIVHFIAYYADQAKIPWTSFPLNPATGISFVLWHEEFTFGTGKKCPFQWLKDHTDELIEDVKQFLKKYQEGTVAGPVTPPPVASAFPVGSWVEFTDVLNVRSEIGTASKVLGVLPAGTTCKVIEGGPFAKDGHTWYHVETPTLGIGWVAGDYLKKGQTPAPPEPVWSPPKPVMKLALLNPDDAPFFTTVNGTSFEPIFDEVECLVRTPQKQFAIDGPVSDTIKVIGPDLKPKDRVTANYKFKNDKGTEYLYLSNHARVLLRDGDTVLFKRVKD